MPQARTNASRANRCAAPCAARDIIRSSLFLSSHAPVRVVNTYLCTSWGDFASALLSLTRSPPHSGYAAGTYDYVDLRTGAASRLKHGNIIARVCSLFTCTRVVYYLPLCPVKLSPPPFFPWHARHLPARRMYLRRDRSNRSGATGVWGHQFELLSFFNLQAPV